MNLGSKAATGGTRATVLVVEDDPSLRLLCRVNLELEGYRVLEAPRIQRAEELLRAEHVDVVLREQYPKTGVCLLSGTSEVDPPREEGVMFIRKPFELEVLSETVRMLAAGEPATP